MLLVMYSRVSISLLTSVFCELAFEKKTKYNTLSSFVRYGYCTNKMAVKEPFCCVITGTFNQLGHHEIV